MKKVIKLSIFILVIPFIFGFTTSSVVAQGTSPQYEYKVLTPLPGTTKGSCTTPGGAGCETDLKKYVEGLFKLLIGLSVAFVVVNFIIGGFMYISSDAISGKSAGKERIKNSVKGLFLVVGAWLILYTVNPNLLNIDLTIDSAKIDSKVMPSGGGALVSTDARGAITATCPTCTNVSTSPNLTAANIARLNCPTCTTITDLPMQGSNMNTYLEPNTLKELQDMNTALQQSGVKWQVSEAWPPVVNHQDSCHYTATCIDATLINKSPTAYEINTFAQKAASSGLTPVWEVTTEARKQQLINSGVTATIMVVPTINGEHFSVYNR